MPSYRFYKKRYYKSRYNRYRKQKFSRYNTYKNRSAKSQAYQIYSLNRRINKIEGNTKPECLEYEGQTQTYNISTSTNPNIWGTKTIYDITELGARFGAVMKNQSCRINKIILWGTIERNTTSNTEIDRDCCGYVRIAFIQYTAARYADIDPDTIFESTTGPTSFKSPLLKGCNTHGRILRVFNIKISSQDPTTKPFKIVLRPRYKIVRKPNDVNEMSTVRMKGGITACVIGLRESNGAAASETINLNIKSKVLYYDA